jgi:Holliday junction resolvasome RuvABC endonuclease subunit
MTSPAICIHAGDSWSFKNCLFFYQTSVKKMHVKTKTFEGSLFKDHITQEERFYNNAAWAEVILKKYQPNFAAVEGYAMGAKGKVFHIGENTGVLKQALWRNNIPFINPPPTVIKKFASGSGGANKEKMEVAFVLETGFDVRKHLGQEGISLTPSSDLIDAYYMCKYAFENQK